VTCSCVATQEEETAGLHAGMNRSKKNIVQKKKHAGMKN
jgi:hypothetical protein